MCTLGSIKKLDFSEYLTKGYWVSSPNLGKNFIKVLLLDVPFLL